MHRLVAGRFLILRRSLTTVRFKIVSAFAACGFIAAAILVALLAQEGPGQPIAFNHRKHAENNIGCQTCHAFASRSARAGMPSILICSRCHEDVVYLSTEKKKLLTYARTGAEIPWRRVYEVPHHVLFSHKRHVVAAKLACPACHGEVTTMSLPLTKPTTVLSMDACIECHRNSFKNPNECLACHR